MYFINPFTGSMFRRMVKVVGDWEKFAASRRKYFINFCQLEGVNFYVVTGLQAVADTKGGGGDTFSPP